jgi:hypothetical protein
VSTPDDWKIPDGLAFCDECDTGPPPGSPVTTILRFLDTGPVRRDFCASCPQAIDFGPGTFIWRHTLPEEGTKRLVVDYALLQEVFGHLIGRREPAYDRLAYLVGLVLVRKRLLRLKRFEARDGQEVMVVAAAAAAPELVVPAPHLTGEELVEALAAETTAPAGASTAREPPASEEP